MNINNTDDTIAAISTPVSGTGGISIIRISGKEAAKIADKIFRAASGVKLSEAPTHTIHYGYIFSGSYHDPIDNLPSTHTAQSDEQRGTQSGVQSGAQSDIQSVAQSVAQSDEQSGALSGALSDEQNGAQSDELSGAQSGALSGALSLSKCLSKCPPKCSSKSLSKCPSQYSDNPSVSQFKRQSNGEIIDEVLVSLMRAPKTFTAEDTVEINCHGGMLVTKKVLEAALKAGARLAEPGEFTKRAFLNGRIDLAQAEGVIDVINAKNDFSLKASLAQINGRLSKQIRGLRDGILDHTAFMEAAMDDPEHISMEGHLHELIKDIDNYILKCDELLRGFDEGRLLKEGISTCILGRTNAGKSSLLNLLTGTESAIVTDIEGTTRDTVRESVRIGDIVLNLTDTAGIRETDDEVEAIGVRKALEAAGEAELIIYVIDASKTVSGEDKDILSGVKDKPCIILLNKADLELKFTSEEAKKIFTGDDNSAEVITFSTTTGEGLNELKEAISKKFHLDEIIVNDAPVSVNVRHKECLENAKKSLLLVREGVNSGITEDLLFVDMMDAYAALGLILGEEIEDDLANRIFEKFCMGK